MFRYCFTSLMDSGRFKWAQMQHKSGLIVKSRRLPFSTMSSTNTLSMTTEFSVSRMKEQMTQNGTFQAEVFWLAKSEGKFALPVWCCKLSWYLLRAIRTEVVRGPAENHPWHRIGPLYISTTCVVVIFSFKELYHVRLVNDLTGQLS